MEEREADGLLELGVAVDLDVGAVPERRRGTRAARPAGRPSPVQRAAASAALDLVAQRGLERRADQP